MKKESQVDDLGEGVFFAPEACAGFFTRLFILGVDITVLLLCGGILQIVWFEILTSVDDPSFGVFWSWIVVAYIYLVFIEAFVGTLGFYLAGVKIVNLKGERPSILRMTGRLFLWLVGPFNILVDIFWTLNDRHKQTLRDKLAGTYVVKKEAVPCRVGRIRAVHYFLFGFSILFPEVREQAVSGRESSP